MTVFTRLQNEATTRVVHSSGRFDRPLGLFETALYRTRLRKGITLITGTEAMFRPKDFLRDSTHEWASAHLSKADAPGYEMSTARELWATWRTDEWELVGQIRAPKVSNMTYVHAARGVTSAEERILVVPLRHKKTGRRVFVLVAHMSLDNTEKRAEVWVDMCRGITRTIAHLRTIFPRAEFILNADLNKNYREVGDRADILHHLALPTGLTQAWDHHMPVKGGTHGPKGLIDDVLTTLDVEDAGLLPDDESSDHRPMWAKLRIRSAHRVVPAPVPAATLAH